MNRQQLIGQKIKQGRDQLGLSQEELGKMYGCSDAQISRIENGLVRIDIGDIDHFASILGKARDWFLSDDVKSPPRPPEAALSELEVSIKAYIPVYAEISAGPGNEPIDYVAVTRARAAPDTLRAYRVKGLCLTPEIQDGDTLIVNTSLAPQNGDLVIVTIAGESSVKRYREVPEGKPGFSKEGKSEYKWLENNGGKYQPEDVYLHGVVVEFTRKMR